MLIHLSQFLYQGSINERKGLVKYKCLNWYVEEEEKEQQEIFDENIFLCHRNNNKPQSTPTYAHKVSSSSTSSTPQITWYSYILSSCSVVCFLWTDEGTHNSISPKLSSPAVHKWRIGLSFYEFAQGTRRCDGTQQQTTYRQAAFSRQRELENWKPYVTRVIVPQHLNCETNRDSRGSRDEEEEVKGMMFWSIF